ncbi:MAG: TonB-dependent receptor [Acidobacteria bacterium]|nr:TonB-dependent receptor [Acidobacteriota bacterium]
MNTFQALGFPAHSVKRTLLALALGLLCANVVLAQIKSGTITGNVTDTSGSVVAGATVAVTEQNTNQKYDVATNADGEFTVPYLQAGVYSITVKQSGFSTYVQSGLPLTTGQSARVNITLQVGQVENQINVEANVAQLQTETATVSNAVNERVIQTLPNVTHNALNYVALQQGMTPRARFNDSTGPNSFGIGIEGRRQFSAFSANGGQAFTNDIQLDGVSIQGSAWNEVAVTPNSDGIQEVRTNINNFTAEYGRGQAVVSLTTKSGTNEYHGSGFMRHRNDKLNANSFSNNARAIARPEFKVYTYGGTFGGSVRIPKLYNGKDKLVFFTSYEGLSFDQGAVFLRTVPTERERKGDFSQTLVNVRGTATKLQLFDPYKVTATGNNAFTRQEIPNAIITNPDPNILRLFSNYPLPNRTPDDAFGTNNFIRTATRTFSRNNLNSRVDYRLGQNHSLYFTGGLNKGIINTPSTWADDSRFSSGAEGFARLTQDNNYYGSLGDTWTLSPSLVADIRFGFNRISTQSRTPGYDDLNYADFGIPARLQAAIQLPGVPPNFFTSGAAYWSALEANAYQHKFERQTNLHLVGNLTKTLGKWTLKGGAEFRNLLSNYTDNQESISFRVDGGLTAGPIINTTGGLVNAVDANQGGHAYASLLLGAGNLEIGQGFNVKPALSQKYSALYTQNDWRPTQKLTLNLGLRWDFQAPPTDRFNRASSVDLNGKNPFGTRGEVIFPGTNRPGGYLWQPEYDNFGPRLGFAYRLTESTVVRGGYGLTYLPTNTGYFDGAYNYGMGSYSPYLDSNRFGTNPQGVVVGNFADVTRVIIPTANDLSAPALYGNSNPRFDYNHKNGRSHQWNLFVQRQFGKNWLASAGYVGTRGTRLPIGSVSFGNNDQFLSDSTLNEWRADYIARNGTGNKGTDQVANPYQPATGALIPFTGSLGNRTLQLRQTLYAFPHLLGFTAQRSLGFSNYNGLQLQIERRFASGLQFNAHYTWSKQLQFTNTNAQSNGFDDGAGVGGFDLINLDNNKYLASTDIPHRFVTSYVYELPFGKGGALAAGNAVVRAIAGGWRTGGSVTLQTGTPDNLGGASNNSLNGRTHRLAGVPIEVPKELQRWYDGRTTVTLPSGRRITPCNFCFLRYSSDAFQGEVVTTANGSLQRNVYWRGSNAPFHSDYRTENVYLWNMSVQRDFRFKERYVFEFSANFQNMLNRANFVDYNGNLGNIEIRNNSASGILPKYGDSSNFGTHGLGTLDPRQVELALKFRF